VLWAKVSFVINEETYATCTTGNGRKKQYTQSTRNQQCHQQYRNQTSISNSGHISLLGKHRYLGQPILKSICQHNLIQALSVRYCRENLCPANNSELTHIPAWPTLCGLLYSGVPCKKTVAALYRQQRTYTARTSRYTVADCVSSLQYHHKYQQQQQQRVPQLVLLSLDCQLVVQSAHCQTARTITLIVIPMPSTGTIINFSYIHSRFKTHLFNKSFPS